MSARKDVDFGDFLKFQRKFVAERDWEKFHTPKNLCMALGGETGELLEIFQWLTDDESANILKDPAKAEKVKDELADIFYYLLRLSDKLGVDLNQAFWEKMTKNEKKYPVHLAKGRADKYTDL